MSVIAQGQTEIMKQYKFYQVLKDSNQQFDKNSY